MRNVLIVFVVLTITSCAIKETKIVGVYRSSCSLYAQPKLQIKLNADQTFEYNIAYLEERVIGTWKLNGSSIILESEFFQEDHENVSFPNRPKQFRPVYKFTKNEGKDIYLVKRRKLFAINDTVIEKKCYLFKIK